MCTSLFRHSRLRQSSCVPGHSCVRISTVAQYAGTGRDHLSLIKLTGFWSQPCPEPGPGPFCENTLSCIADFSLFMHHTAPRLLLLGSSYLWEQMFCVIRIKESQVRLQKTKHPLSGSSRISELTFKEKVRGKEGQQTGQDKRWKCHFNSYGSGGFHCKGLKGAGFSALGQES